MLLSDEERRHLKEVRATLLAMSRVFPTGWGRIAGCDVAVAIASLHMVRLQCVLAFLRGRRM